MMSLAVDTRTRPFTPKVEMVGREREVAAIRGALKTMNTTEVLCFVGRGGIGKTRLLEEAEKLAQDVLETQILYPSIIDMYHAEMHSPEGVRSALAKDLDGDDHWFMNYWNQAAKLAAQVKAAVPGETLTNLQVDVTRAFVDDYAKLARKHRILLRFDTLEVLQHERDAIQELCEFGQEMGVRNWLLGLLPQLPNTVVLLASRLPTGTDCRQYDLDCFSRAEAQEYIDKIAVEDERLKSLDPSILDRVYRVTEGEPIRLSLAIDLLLNGWDVANLLTTENAQVPLSKDEIDGRIIREFRTRIPDDKKTVVYYLALARKQLDADLLHALEPRWTRKECQARLDAIRDDTYVKPRPRSSALFLHDVMADLYNDYELSEPPVRLLDTIIQHYDRRIGAVKDPAARRILQIEQLYYCLRQDPLAGFMKYQDLSNEAIDAGLLDHDIALRDELLRFFNNDRLAEAVRARSTLAEELNRDAALRWVQRYTTGGKNYDRAISIGERLVDQNHPWFTEADVLYRGAFRVTYAQALIYNKAPDEKSSTLLTQTIDDLASWTSDEAKHKARRDQVIGRAHNFLGYSHRVYGRYETAEREYKEAVGYFWPSLRGDLATTRRNLGFLKGLKGQLRDADSLLDDAIKDETELGLEFPRGLSENTLGLSYIYGRQPDKGIEQCRKAFRRFEKMSNPRGMGLAHLALGLGLRNRGNAWKKQEDYKLAKAVTDFKAAEAELLKARQIFEDASSREPSRLAETHDELGSLYIDWGWLVQTKRNKVKNGDQRNELLRQAEEFYQKAEEDLQEGIAIAKEGKFDLQVMDMLDDLSQAYSDRALLYPITSRERQDYLNRSQELVEEISAAVPQEYRQSRRESDRISDPHQDWWLVLGKIELAQGARQLRDIATVASEERDTRLKEAVIHYASAVAFFQSYSPDSPRMDETLESILRRLEIVSKDELSVVRSTIRKYEIENCVQLKRLNERLNSKFGSDPSAPNEQMGVGESR